MKFQLLVLVLCTVKICAATTTESVTTTATVTGESITGVNYTSTTGASLTTAMSADNSTSATVETTTMSAIVKASSYTLKINVTFWIFEIDVEIWIQAGCPLTTKENVTSSTEYERVISNIYNLLDAGSSGVDNTTMNCTTLNFTTTNVLAGTPYSGEVLSCDVNDTLRAAHDFDNSSVPNSNTSVIATELLIISNTCDDDQTTVMTTAAPTGGGATATTTTSYAGNTEAITTAPSVSGTAGSSTMPALTSQPAQTTGSVTESQSSTTIKTTFETTTPSSGMDACSMPCHKNANCTNVGSSYTCKCNTGFDGDGRMCADVNECANTATCSKMNTVCVNTAGSHRCDCRNGYMKNATDYCVDENECNSAMTCPANSTCSNTDGSFRCTCNNGFVKNGAACVDINECALSTDNCDQQCTNTFGGFQCSCITGFTRNETTKTCEANQTCSDPNFCGPNAVCYSNGNNDTCVCNSGFKVTNNTHCQDINECADSTLNTCTNGTGSCTNIDGSYTCGCITGYQLASDDRSCFDVDECSDGTASCDANALCTNVEGSYNCTCNGGYAGNGTICTNINECSGSLCHANAACTDNDGSFTCACSAGYQGNGFACFDINECTSNPCHVNADCNNTAGSYRCMCKAGYTGDGASCTAIDPCLNSTVVQDCKNRNFTRCVLTGPGVHSCEGCLSGWTLKGGICRKLPRVIGRVTITFENGQEIVWTVDLTNRNSARFIQLYKACCESFVRATSAISCDISSFTQGSIIVNFELGFPENATNINQTEIAQGILDDANNTGIGLDPNVELTVVTTFCEGGACKNDGVCYLSGSMTMCNCTGGFTGSDCSISPPQPVDPCLDSTVVQECKNNGFRSCVNDGSGRHHCENCLLAGWTAFNGSCKKLPRVIGRVVIENRIFEPDLTNRTSTSFISLETLCCNIFKRATNALVCNITSFTNGSIITDFEVVFPEITTNINTTLLAQRILVEASAGGLELHTDIAMNVVTTFCEDATCMNGGVCFLNTSYLTNCNCVNGFTGSDCSIPPPTPSTAPDQGLNTEAIIGIAVGCAVGLLIIVIIIAVVCCKCKGKNKVGSEAEMARQRPTQDDEVPLQDRG